MNWRETVAQCLQSESLTAWEVEFLRGIENSGPEYQLSQRQQAALDRIAKKLKVKAA